MPKVIPFWSSFTLHLFLNPQVIKKRSSPFLFSSFLFIGQTPLFFLGHEMECRLQRNRKKVGEWEKVIEWEKVGESERKWEKVGESGRVMTKKKGWLRKNRKETDILFLFLLFIFKCIYYYYYCFLKYKFKIQIQIQIQIQI